MVLAGLGLNPAGVSLFRMHAPQSPLTRNWLPLEAWILAFFGPWSWWLHHLLFVVALHHLSVSLGRQNATLGSFTGDGFGRFGLESCWGFSVSDACSTEPFDEEVASAWILAFFGPWSWWLHHLLFVGALHGFFRPSERNVRQFYGGWFCLNPAGVSLVACMPHRALWLSAWGLNPRVLRALILESWWLHHLLFVVALHHLFCFFRPSERNVRQFYGGWFWQVWAWILLGFPCFGCMPHRALWRGIGFRLRLESSRSSGLDLGGCLIFCLWLHCIIFLFL